MLQFATRVFPWLAAMIALTFAWIGFDELQYDSASRPHQLPSILFALAVSVLFGIAAVSFWLRWRTRNLAALMCGSGLALFTISALIQRWDEVSVAVGVAIVAIAGTTAVLGLILGIGRWSP
jgi:hypothetical protein